MTEPDDMPPLRPSQLLYLRTIWKLARTESQSRREAIVENFEKRYREIVAMEKRSTKD